MASAGASAASAASAAAASAASSAPPHQQPSEVHWALQPALADGETEGEDEEEEEDEEEDEAAGPRGNHYSEAETDALLEMVSSGGGEPCSRGLYDRKNTSKRRSALAYWGGVGDAMVLRGFRRRSVESMCRHWRQHSAALAAAAAGRPAASASAVGGRKRSAGAAFAAAPPPQQQLTAVEQQRAAFGALCVAYYQLGRLTREEFEAERAALLAWR